METQQFIGELAVSVMTSVAAENFVFARAFGVSTMIMAAKNKRNLPGICLGVCYFTLLASGAAWAVSQRAGIPADAPYIPLIYALVIGGLYAVTLALAFFIFRGKFGRIRNYVHISAFNSAVMGTIFLCGIKCRGLGQFLLFGGCAGLGFTAASLLLSGVYGQLYSQTVPRAFRGYPAVMLFAGIMAMAVYAILGHAPAFA